MMTRKELTELRIKIYRVSDSPSISDEMRNKAADLACYLGKVVSDIQLKDNPAESDWQELKIDDLPDMSKTYDSEVLLGEIYCRMADLRENLASLFLGEIDHPIRYRKRPEKKHPEKTPMICAKCMEETFIEDWPHHLDSCTGIPEKKHPSHEEIMTLWWFIDGTWVRVVNYIPKNRACYCYTDIRDNESYWTTKECFKNYESAAIPPEATK